MYVQCKIEAHLFNHCCSIKAISIIYSECVFLGLGIQRAMRIRHIAICGLSGCAIFFHIITQTARFSVKKQVIEYKMCFGFIYKLFPKHFSS